MKKVFFLLFSLLISCGVLFAKGTKTDGTVIGRVDRSAWKAIACSSERADDGGGIAALLDGNHNNHWHSQWGPDLQPPHWVIIDLGENGAREFTAFQIYKRNSNTHYQKTVEIYVSDEPTEPDTIKPLPADNAWTLIGEGQFNTEAKDRMLTVETPGGAENQGRYLLFYFPDSWNTFVVAAEIYGLGPIDENSYKGTPYPGPNGHAVPGVIEAEDFDKGGQGVGYRWFDADIRHNQAYMDSVLLEDPEYKFDYSNYRWDAEDGDVYILDGPGDGNRHLAHFNIQGEYLNYTINVAESYHYDLSFLAATTGADRFFQVLLDDQPLCSDYSLIPGDKPVVNWDNGYYPVINTGDWAKYVNNEVEKAYITAGKHVLRVYGYFDFDKITIKKSYVGIPFPEVHTLPCIIQAEDFDEGAAEVSYHVATPGTNTYRPNTSANIVAGPAGEDGEDNYVLATGDDWYIYTINVPEAKSYNYVFAFHGQRTSPSNFLTMEINGEVDEELTAQIDFPISYDEPFEIYKAIKLTQGKNILKIKANGGNLDKIEIMEGPFEYEGAPFFDTPYIVSAIEELVIEAEYFDRGGREITFHDNTTNGGNDVSKSVRGEEDGSANVEMEYRNPQGGTNATIGWSNEGEWLAYSISVEEEGEYDIFYVLSTNNGDRKQHIEVDGVAYPEIIARTPGDWLTWMDILVGSKVKLTTGIHILYAYYYGNFDKIKIRKHSDIFPYEYNPQAIPGVIQAWKFDEGGESLTYGVSDKTLGGTNNAIREDVAVPIRGSEGDYYVDVVESGTPSWLLYTVDVKETGYYKLTFKVAPNIGDESFTLSNRFWSAKAAFPEASSSEWQDITFPIVKLNEGLDTLKLTTSGSGAKIASIKFEPVTDIIDRSNWTVEVSDEKPSDGGGKDAMFDDDFTTFWHSNYPLSENPDADLPHWAIIDLGYPVEISQIITIRRSNGDPKTLQYSVSNDPNSDVWTIIAEGEYAAQSDGIHNLTLDATQIVKARYLKLFLPDSYRDIFIGIAEVYVIGKEYQGIKHVEALPGKVYAENGILKVKEFPASASLAVYNILGQKITAYKTVNDGAEIKLPSKGIYIVKIQNKGFTSSYKVVVK